MLIPAAYADSLVAAYTFNNTLAAVGGTEWLR